MRDAPRAGKHARVIAGGAAGEQFRRGARIARQRARLLSGRLARARKGRARAPTPARVTPERPFGGPNQRRARARSEAAASGAPNHENIPESANAAPAHSPIRPEKDRDDDAMAPRSYSRAAARVSRGAPAAEVSGREPSGRDPSRREPSRSPSGRSSPVASIHARARSSHDAQRSVASRGIPAPIPSVAAAATSDRAPGRHNAATTPRRASVRATASCSPPAAACAPARIRRLARGENRRRSGEVQA